MGMTDPASNSHAVQFLKLCDLLKPRSTRKGGWLRDQCVMLTSSEFITTRHLRPSKPHMQSFLGWLYAISKQLHILMEQRAEGNMNSMPHKGYENNKKGLVIVCNGAISLGCNYGHSSKTSGLMGRDWLARSFSPQYTMVQSRLSGWGAHH